MSKEIDSKVVEMRFDNKDFEANAQESISTLDRLKKALNFEGAEKAFNELERAANNTDISALGKATEAVSLKFNSLEVAAITAISNITNSAVEAGKQLVKSLSTDNIEAGWQKFGEMTVSTGTLVAQGYELEKVNEQLERLNWFTDETSYNLTDMVENIAKFTATGQDLETSVTAMEGIATWAALSGQNAQVASRAMYNISQAMGAGAMKLIDYKSIQNASMDTDEFRQKVLAAAVELGTLNKVADDTYETLDGKGQFSKSQFTQELAKGWFTSDVMMKVFNDYSASVDEIMEYSEKEAMTASEVISTIHEKSEEEGKSINEVIKEMGMNFDEFSLKALESAQEARTWGDVIDSVKDAVSTGWMNTFKNIFGDYEEAKSLWTDLANELYDVFAEGGNQRNELLSEWKDLGGRQALLDAFWESFHALTDVVNLFKEAFADIFPPMTASKLVEITEKVRDFAQRLRLSEDNALYFKTVLKGLFSILDMGVNVVKAFVKGITPLFSVFSGGDGAIKSFILDISEFLIEADKAAVSLHVYDELAYRLQLVFGNIAGFVKNIASSNIADFMTGFARSGNILTGILAALEGNIGNIINLIFYVAESITGLDLSGARDNVVSVLNDIATFVYVTFDNVINFIKSLFSGSSGSIGQAFVNIFSDIGNGIKRFVASINQNGSGTFTSIVENISEFLSGLVKNDGKTTLAERVITGLGKVIDNIKNNISLPSLRTILAVINTGALVLIAKSIMDFLDNLQSGGPFAELLDGITGTLEEFQSKLKAETILSISKAITLMAASLVALAMLPTEQLASAMVGLGAAFAALMVAMDKIGDLIDAQGAANLGKAATLILSMSVSLVALTASLMMLSKLNMQELMTGLAGVIGLLWGLVTAARQMSGLTDNVAKTAASLIIMAAALNMLVAPIIAIGLLPVQDVAEGTGAIAASILALAGSAKILGTIQTNIAGAAASLMLIALALDMLAPSVIAIGLLPFNDVVEGVGAIVTLLVFLTGAAVALGKLQNGILKASAAMVLMAVALNALVAPVALLGAMDPEQIGQGMLEVVGGLSALFIFAVGLSELSGDILKASAAMVLMSAAITALIVPIAILGAMDHEQLGQGLLFATGGLAALTLMAIGLGTAAPQALAGAAAALIMATALNALILPIEALGAMDETDRKDAITALSTALLALTGATVALGLAGPLAIAGAAAFATLAISISAIALSASLAAPAIIALTLAAPAMAQAITTAIHTLGEASPQISEDLLKILDTITKTIGAAVGGIVKVIVDIVLGAVWGILAGLNDFIGPLLDVVLNICIQILRVLEELAPPLIEVIINVIDELLQAIAEYIPVIVRVAYDMVITLVNAIADEVLTDENGAALRDAVLNLLVGIGEFILGFFGIDSEMSRQIGDAIFYFFMHLGAEVEKAVENIQPIFEDIGEFITMFVSWIELGYKEIHDTGESIKAGVVSFFNAIKETIQSVVDWLNGVVSEVTGAIDTVKATIGVAFDGVNSFRSEAAEAAGFLAGGLADGLESSKPEILASVTQWGKDILTALKVDAFDEHSNSKETTEDGEFLAGGLDDGLWNKFGAVKESVSKWGTGILGVFDGMADGAFDSGKNVALSFVKGYESIAPDKWINNSGKLSKEQIMYGTYGIESAKEAMKNNKNGLKSPAEALHDKQMADMEARNEETVDAEKELEEKLNALEIMYNTGAIESEEEYHKRRLDVLENYHGEWTKKSSKWLKDERDWFKKQEEQEKKAAEKAAKASAKSKKEDDLVKSLKSAFDNIERMKQRIIDEYDEFYGELTNGIITMEEYDEKYVDLLNRSGFAREYLVEKAGERMQAYANDLFKPITDEFEDKLGDIQSKIDSFAQNARGDLASSFTFKTQKDVDDETYNNAIEDFDIEIKQLTKKRDTAVKLYGENNWYAKKLQKDLDDTNKRAEEYKNRHELQKNHYGDETLMALDEQINQLTEQRDSIVKMYGENNRKAQELKKQIAELEKQEDEYMSSEEYRQKRKDREKNKNKADSKIVGVQFTDTLKDDVKTLEEYQAELKKLTSKENIGGDFLDIFAGLTTEEGVAFAKYLNGLTDDELNEIESQWEKKKELSKNLGEEMYKEDVEIAIDEFTEDINQAFNKLPDSAKEAGKKALQALGDGFSEQSNDTLATFDNTMYDILGSIYGSVDDESLKKYLTTKAQQAKNIIVEGMGEIQVKITPVWDMSLLENDLAILKNSGMKVPVSSNISAAAASMSNSKTSAGKVSGESSAGSAEKNAILSSIDKKIDAGFGRLENAIGNVDIVIDRNSLADGLAAPLNNRIGKLVTLRNRGG